MTCKKLILPLLLTVLLIHIAPAFGSKISKTELDRLRMVDKLLKAQIGEMESEFKASPALDKYRVEYLATVACKTPKAFSAAQIAKIIDQARFVFLGDEHTTAESQKNTINVLNLMKRNSRPVTLVLEWIDESHQEVINQFLEGKFSGTELRKKIAFDKDWGFSWADYSKVLASAKKLKVPVLLVERLKKRHSLSERDTHIAGKIAEDANKNEHMRYLTVYGEYHLLGPGHLTEKCSKLGLKSQAILVGDAPEVYWKLLAQTMDPDQVEFAQLKGNVYFIRNGTPLERSMSYRNYLMKILGYKASDFEDRVGATDIIPKAGAAASFDELHQTR